MGITTNDRPCVHITLAGGADVAEEWMDPHYDPTRLGDMQSALDLVQEMTREDAEEGQRQAFVLRSLDHACSALACDGCGYRFDEDGDGVYHDDSPDHLASTATAEGWTRVGAKWFCLAEDCQVEAKQWTRQGA